MKQNLHTDEYDDWMEKEFDGDYSEIPYETLLSMYIDTVNHRKTIIPVGDYTGIHHELLCRNIALMQIAADAQFTFDALDKDWVSYGDVQLGRGRLRVSLAAWKARE